jgi:cell wall-associated NlpC family hydrolase
LQELRAWRGKDVAMIRTIAPLMCCAALAAFWPAGSAQAGTATSTTQQGVVVIDMNAPPPTPAPQAPKGPLPPAAAKPPLLHGADALLRNALAYIGAPYRLGGTSPSGFDCSGFTQFAFASVGVKIPRTADQQFYRGRPIAGDPLPGDLVFFQTYQYGPSHVGIYLGAGQFLNSIGKDVHIESFDSSYFRGRYLGARRYLPG